MSHNQNLAMLTASLEDTNTSPSGTTIPNSTLTNPAPADATASTASDTTALTAPIPPAPVAPVTAPAATKNQPSPQPTVTDDIPMSQDDENEEEKLSRDQMAILIRTINDSKDNPQALAKALHTSPVVMDFRELMAIIHPDKWKEAKDKEDANKAFQSMLLGPITSAAHHYLRF
jgi:hypothetical protein